MTNLKRKNVVKVLSSFGMFVVVDQYDVLSNQRNPLIKKYLFLDHHCMHCFNFSGVVLPICHGYNL